MNNIDNYVKGRLSSYSFISDLLKDLNVTVEFVNDVNHTVGGNKSTSDKILCDTLYRVMIESSVYVYSNKPSRMLDVIKVINYYCPDDIKINNNMSSNIINKVTKLVNDDAFELCVRKLLAYNLDNNIVNNSSSPNNSENTSNKVTRIKDLSKIAKEKLYHGHKNWFGNDFSKSQFAWDLRTFDNLFNELDNCIALVNPSTIDKYFGKVTKLLEDSHMEKEWRDWWSSVLSELKESY